MLAAVRLDYIRLNRGRSGRFRRLGGALASRGFQALVAYRISHFLWQHRVPIVPLILSRVVNILYGIDFDFRANLGPGCVIIHGVALVIGGETSVEGDCIFYHGVTLGTRGSEWIGDWITDGHPRVERGCIFGAGSKVLGPLTVGRNSVIGANAVVTRDVEPNSVMAGVPARRISERPQMDENMRSVSGARRTSR